MPAKMKRMNLFLPDYAVDSYQSLDVYNLKNQGIRLLFVDIDNTLTTEQDAAIRPQAVEFLNRLIQAGMIPVLFTNNTKKHVERVLHGYPDIHLQTFVCKPLPFSIWRVLMHYRLQPAQAAVFGDQLFTDILGGQLAGVKTILSSPLTQDERMDTKILRKLENIVYGRLERKGKLKRRGQHVRIL